MKQFPMSLDRRNHPGHHILWPEQANRFRLEARPRARRELAQQLPIEPSVQSQTLGDGQNDLSMRDGKTDFFGNVDRGQQRPLLVAGWAGTTLLAGEGDEHLVLAVWAANASNTLLEIPCAGPASLWPSMPVLVE